MIFELESYLKKILPLDWKLERTSDEKFGDYASSAAFRVFKEALRQAQGVKSPMEVAEELASKIKKVDTEGWFLKVEAAAPGFINFWVSKRIFIEHLGKIALRQAQGEPLRRMTGGRKRINFEFVSANPTGPLTMANGRGGFLGNTLSNLLEMVGHDVTREYYINDAGVQIRKLGASILAALKLIPDSEDHYQGSYVKELAKKLKKTINQEIKKSRNQKEIVPPERDPAKGGDFRYLAMTEEVGRLAAAELLVRIKKSLKNVGIKYDKWFSEYKELRRVGALEKTLGLLKSRGMVYERDGAVWLRTAGQENNKTMEQEDVGGEIATSGLAMTEKDGGKEDDKDRVLIKSDGDATYFLADLAYHYNKFIERKFDEAYVIWGADHHGYVGRLRAGISAMGIEGDRFKAIIVQLIRLVKGGEEVKMSKRKGEFITLDDLVKEVGADAAKFFFLMHAPETHMDFDMALAKERSVKNPVYYAQYALVRCYGILRKAGIRNKESGIKGGAFELLKEASEIRLIKELAQFDDVIIQTAKDFGAHRLIKYSLELAKALHNFYDKERVIVDDKNLMRTRLALVFTAKNIFEKLFDVIGISKPKKM